MEYREINNRFFRRWARVYDALVWPLHSLRKRVTELAGAAPGKKVLDVACGTGEQSIAFAARGCSVTGIDLSKDMLARARRKTRPGMDLTFLCDDARRLPFADGTFDCVTISLALHDMPWEVARDILREMCRVAAVGAPIVIVDYRKPSGVFDRILHMILGRFESRWYRFFLQQGLDTLLKEAGGFVIRQRLPVFAGGLEILVCTAA